MEEKMGMYDWLTIATRGIRFKPDREAVRNELREHMYDKIDDLRRLFPDMTFEEAQERAIRDMGDPNEIGKALAKIHKPLLGWLWRLSRVALWAAAALMVYFLVVSAVGKDYLGGWYSAVDYHLDYTNSESIWGPAQKVTYLKPWDGSVKVDGCRLTVETVVLNEWEDERRLAVVLRCWSPYFWMREGTEPRYRMSAVDDQGNYYPSYREWEEWVWEGIDIYSQRRVDGERGGNTPVYQEYVYWVWQVDMEAKELTLNYNWMGRSFSIPVNLEEVAK